MEPISTLVTYSAICVAIVTVLYWYGTRPARRLEATFPGVPGPKPWPFIGTLPDFLKAKGQIHIQLDAYYKKFGRLFAMNFVGIQSLVVSDPEMLKDVFVKNFDCFHDRPMNFKFPKPVDKSLIQLKAEDWKRVRSTLSPAFSAHKLKSMTSLMNVACDTLIKKVGKVAESGGSFDIISYQQAVTLDAIMSTAFGIQSDFQNNPQDPTMRTVIKAMKPNAVLQFITNVVLPMFPYGRDFISTNIGGKIFFKNMIDTANIVQDVVDIRRKGTVRKDLLDLMLNATHHGTSGNKKLTDDEVVAQSVIFLLAGYETSSTTLSMTCYYLATNADVQQRLQEEIDSVWTDEDAMPSYETVHELPYLDMVISETLRICPPAFIISRACNKECVIKGLKIPKDSMVAVLVQSMHMDPEFYPDPEKFDPERFSVEAKKSRNPYTYLPFGHGPRNCIGMRFAQMEMKLVLMRLMKKYTFFVAPETQVPPVLVAKVTLGPQEMVLGVRKRSSL